MKWIFVVCPVHVFSRSCCYQKRQSSAKSETWANTCATCQQIRGGSSSIFKGTAEVVEFVFSARKHLSFGMYHRCFLSEASGNCYIFKNPFYFILFYSICFISFYFLTSTSSDITFGRLFYI